MSLSKRISDLRLHRGLKQSELANLLDLSQSSYSRIENKAEKLTIEQLEKIAEALGVSAVELMTGEPQKVEDTGKVENLQKEIIELRRSLENANKWLADKDLLIKHRDRDFANIQESATSFIYSQMVDYFAKEREFEYIGVKIVNRETGKTEAILSAKEIDELPKIDSFLRVDIGRRYALKHQLGSVSLSEVYFMQSSKRLHGVNNFFGGRDRPLDEIAWLLLEIISLGFTNDAILNFIYMKYKRGDYEGITILSEEHEEELGKSFQEWMLLPEEEKQKIALERIKTFELEFENYLSENKDRLKHEPDRIFKKEYFERQMI
jgi:transcriptional regulator with XRE-family HTH domain